MGDSVFQQLPLLIVLVGLPRAGKTTWRNEHYGSAPVVSPDAIRMAMHGQRFSGPAERFVWAVAHVMVDALFLAGHPCVVVDGCHVTRKRRDEWQDGRYRVRFKVIEASAAECRQRAAETGREDVLPAIDRMAAAWEPLQDGEEALS